jgi:hypothetical protein
MRPPKIRKIKDCGPLHDLLIRACPPTLDDKTKLERTPSGVKSIRMLARWLGMSAWGVQKWANTGRIPPQKARKIVDLNPEEVTLADFSPFVYFEET